MITCPKESKLLAYIDRELPDAEQRQLTEHLADCPAFAAQMGSLRISVEMVDGLLSELSEMPFRAAAIPAADLQPAYLKRFAAGFAMAACVLLAALLTPGILFKRPAPPQPVHEFVALDTQRTPIQLGAVVKVSLPLSLFDPAAPGGQKVQAEVLLGDDGSPRAIRVLE